MSGLVARLWSLIRSKQLVGKDKAGNLFYRQSIKVDGVTKDRRWVEYKGDPDPKNLPVEWYTWLIGRRKEAPTPEEIATLEAHRKLVKMKAAMVEKEEERRKLRSKILQQDSVKDEIKPPHMNTFIKQVAELEGTKFDGGEGNFVEGTSGIAAITAQSERWNLLCSQLREEVYCDSNNPTFEKLCICFFCTASPLVMQRQLLRKMETINKMKIWSQADERKQLFTRSGFLQTNGHDAMVWKACLISQQIYRVKPLIKETH